MAVRALAGTRDAYRPCGTCAHPLLHHEQRGRGRCSRIVTLHTIVEPGRVAVTPRRCGCPRHTISERTT